MNVDFNSFWVVIISVVGLVGTINGIILPVINRSKQEKKDAKQEAYDESKLQQAVGYIRLGIDEMKLDFRKQSERFEKYMDKNDEKYNDLAQKVVKLEESDKSLHKRVDSVELRINYKKE